MGKARKILLETTFKMKVMSGTEHPTWQRGKM